MKTDSLREKCRQRDEKIYIGLREIEREKQRQRYWRERERRDIEIYSGLREIKKRGKDILEGRRKTERQTDLKRER